jgi:selenoprotein W-related protein
VVAELLEQRSSQISELTLIPSSGGVFEITVGDKLVFSKKEQSRYPDEGETVRLFEEAAK